MAMRNVRRGVAFADQQLHNLDRAAKRVDRTVDMIDDIVRVAARVASFLEKYVWEPAIGLLQTIIGKIEAVRTIDYRSLKHSNSY